VSGLEKDFPGRVKTQNLNAKDPESQKVIQEAGFKSHGLIIRDARHQIVWKQADHTVNMDQVKAEIRTLLAATSKPKSQQ
jgi:hypothetical protein